MKELVQEKARAIALRKKGYSYKEIMQEVPVAKSSISLWLKDLPLTKAEKEYLKTRRDSNITRGRIKSATANRTNRLAREKELLITAKEEFARHASEPLFHTGVALYWAEGGKRNSTFLFMNSDPEMIEVMLLWIERYTDFSRADLGYRLYIHKPYAHENCEGFWAKSIKVPLTTFKKTVYKPSGLGVKKRPNYKGCVRIEVPRSTALLVKTKFWMQMMVEYYRKQ